MYLQNPKRFDYGSVLKQHGSFTIDGLADLVSNLSQQTPGLKASGPLAKVLGIREQHLELALYMIKFPNNYSTLPPESKQHQNITGRGEEYYVFEVGNVLGSENPLVRLHSACLHGDNFGHIQCDCGDQYKMALEAIAKEEKGLLVYAYSHDGRAVGHEKHFEAYMVQQEKGVDTFESFRMLNLPVDPRDYSNAARILTDFYGLHRVRLLTNNPLKVKPLEENGIEVEMVPIWTEETPFNTAQIRARIKSGHIPLEKEKLKTKPQD